MWRLFKCLFFWGTPAPQGNVRDAQIILVQANADLEDGSSSKINIALAHAAAAYHNHLDLPIFAQGEVATVLKDENIPLMGQTPCQLTHDHHAAEYRDTYAVAELQSELCRRMVYTRILPIAPTPHLWRVIWVYQKLGFTVIIPPDACSMVYQKELRSWYWRTPLRAHLYELVARLLYLYRGYL